MTVASHPPCPTCGDPRLVSLGGRLAGLPGTTWLLYACGHWIRTDGTDGRVLTIVTASTERELAKRRHPSAQVERRRKDPGVSSSPRSPSSDRGPGSA